MHNKFIPFIIAFSICISLHVEAQISFRKVELDTFLIYDFRRNGVLDMNGDHLDDIIKVSREVVTIYYQKENPSHDLDYYIKRHYFERTTTPFWGMCGGDLDNNGFNDLLIGDSRTVSFIHADSNGNNYTEDYKPLYIFAQRPAMADINNDGLLDAFVCHDEDENHPYRNDGNQNMTLDQELIKTPEDTPGNYQSSWLDYDNDGDLDMYLTKCLLGSDEGDPFRTNLLYNNDGNNNYTEVGQIAGMDDISQSWVTVFEDFDLDGDFDAFIFNHESSNASANKFMRNNGDGTFTDVIETTLLDPKLLGTREAIAVDFDNDGDMDMMADFPNRLYINQGDMTFETVFLEFPVGTFGDLNNDGFVDLYGYNNIYYNEGNDNNWIRINTIGRQSNRNGIGARLELYGDWGRQIQEVRATQSYSSMNTLGITFGIGEYTSIDSLVIKWPAGTRTVIANPDINSVINADENNCPFEILNLEIVGSPNLCTGQEVILVAPSGYDTYQWSNGESSEQITTATSGHYNVTVTNNLGCSNYSEVIEVINTEEAIDIDLPLGPIMCEGVPTLIEVDTNYDVVWSDGQEGSAIYVYESGDYFATVTTPCGTTIQTNTVTLAPLVMLPPDVDDIDINSQTTTFSIEAPVQPGAITNYWYLNDSIESSFYVGNSLFVNNFMTDTTFYLSSLYFGPNNANCFSERVPVHIFFTAADDIEKQIGLKVYPNPTNEYLFLEMDNISKLKGLSLMTLYGEQLKYSISQDNNLIKLDLSDIQSGIYLLELSIGQNRITKRIIRAE